MTIHLSPADMRKSGSGFDCEMLLAVIQELTEDSLSIQDNDCILASLSLSGAI